MILFGIFQFLPWHKEEQEGKAFTKFLSQISSQCVLTLGGEKWKPSRSHPSKWQQLRRNQISVTWSFVNMNWDWFDVSVGITWKPFLLTSCWYSLAVPLWVSPRGFFQHPWGSCFLPFESGPSHIRFQTEPGWIWTPTWSGVILLLFTCVSMPVAFQC